MEQKRDYVTEGSHPLVRMISDKAKEVVMGPGPLGSSSPWKDFRFYSG